MRTLIAFLLPPMVAVLAYVSCASLEKAEPTARKLLETCDTGTTVCAPIAGVEVCGEPVDMAQTLLILAERLQEGAQRAPAPQHTPEDLGTGGSSGVPVSDDNAPASGAGGACDEGERCLKNPDRL